MGLLQASSRSLSLEREDEFAGTEGVQPVNGRDLVHDVPSTLVVGNNSSSFPGQPAVVGTEETGQGSEPGALGGTSSLSRISLDSYTSASSQVRHHPNLRF